MTNPIFSPLVEKLSKEGDKGIETKAIQDFRLFLGSSEVFSSQSKNHPTKSVKGTLIVQAEGIDVVAYFFRVRGSKEGRSYEFLPHKEDKARTVFKVNIPESQPDDSVLILIRATKQTGEINSRPEKLFKFEVEQP